MSVRRSLLSAVHLEGTGIHTGAPGRIRVSASAPGSGICFLVSGGRIPALVDYVVDTSRCTALGVSGVRIATVEHLLSALSAHGIDDAEIEVEGPEIPILDGSALPFAQAIEQAGVREEQASLSVVRVTEPMRIEGAGGSSATIGPGNGLTLVATTEFDFWPAGAATARLEAADYETYRALIAPARTFAFRHEVDQLRAAGLARGGSLDNALIIDPENGFSSPLRVPNEWCAHKLLDLLGDLTLVGAQIDATINVVRPGHTLNARIARALREIKDENMQTSRRSE